VERILPTTAYHPLLAYLLSEPFDLVSYLMKKHLKNRTVLASCLVRIFHYQHSIIPYLKHLCVSEIESTIDPNVIFRGNSLASKSLDIFQQLISWRYLGDVLRPHLHALYMLKHPLEVDPQREPREDVCQRNLKQLMATVRVLLQDIFDSSETVPSLIREVYSGMKSCVFRCFAKEDLGTVQYTVVSSFFFLRLICPCILNPKLFGLLDEHPPIHTARTLTLIAKTIQNTANLVPFGLKEPYLIPMNSLIDEAIPHMKEFLSRISEDPLNSTPRPQLQVPIWLDRELSRLHQQLRMVTLSEQSSSPRPTAVAAASEDSEDSSSATQSSSDTSCSGTATADVSQEVRERVATLLKNLHVVERKTFASTIN